MAGSVQYVDSHGASVVGFAFTELLNFRLLPRLKNTGSIRLYRPDDSSPAEPKARPSARSLTPSRYPSAS
ncbi:Tn3 family transposase [Streptomyces anthocyanicus]|uniref:Tn3 family transposase n=1 Tax=Streptomyces anthocyanicus TaxID=68174 RepID=UPI0033A3F5B7